MEYVHNNPLVSGFVSNPEDWKQSSAGEGVGKAKDKVKESTQ
jgi:hypothetical protein